MIDREARLSSQLSSAWSERIRPVLSPRLPAAPSPRPLFPIPRHPTPDTQHPIDQLLAEAERRWGRGALVRWGDTVSAGEVETVPTGFPDLDDALGIGGLPCGRISELFGADSSGKHALAASIVAQCQKQDGVVMWIDPAGRLDPEQMSVQGVEADSLLVANPRCESQALEMAIRLARSGGVRMIVYDLANSSPITQHSALSLALRRLVAAVHRNRIVFLFISEQYGQGGGRTGRQKDNLPLSLGESARSQGPGGSERGADADRRHLPTPPGRSGRSLALPAGSLYSSLFTIHTPSTGGQALRYFASMRLEIERREWIRMGREVVGCRSAVRVVKNKLAAPHREAEVDLYFYPFPTSGRVQRGLASLSSGVRGAPR